MKRHQLMKVMAWVGGSVFMLSASALTFAAYFNSDMWVKALGLVLCNAVLFTLIPVGFFGDDLDVPWGM